MNQHEAGKHETELLQVHTMTKGVQLAAACFSADDQLADLISVFGTLTKAQRKDLLVKKKQLTTWGVFSKFFSVAFSLQHHYNRPPQKLS